jgi:transglutaminase-like putative cysteine protease
VSALALPRPVRIELVCFAALGVVASLQWTSLVAEPPAARVLLAVAVATAAGAALASIGRQPWPRARRLGVAVAAGAVAVCLGLVIVGLPARLLLPVHWGELASNLDRSLHGLTDVPVPYAGADVWTRLVILLAAPLTVGVAALVAFWPGRRRPAGRIWALALLLGLYLTAVSWERPDGQLAAGVLLVILVCAWLWLPSIERGRGVAATFAVAAVSVVAVPIAALVDPGRSLIDYRGWDLFSAHGLSFSWDQSYGPLDWPQKGTLILEVSSEDVHYWKATNLDTFDGVRWGRGATTDAEPVLGAPLGFRSDGRIASPNPEWIDRIGFEVRGLTSDFAIGAGTILGVRRAEASPDPDGVWPMSEELKPGDSYSALVYDPQPTPAEMRAAGIAYPEQVGRYVSFTLTGGPDGSRSIDAPLWGASGPATIADQVQGTPYESMYGLARELATGAATPYDAARRIELHLRANYEYRQDVPSRLYPLPAFLDEDRAGYCQQFSGSMALMLRMLGIPSRVVGGFSPGGRDPARDDYLVDDTDAHNWVEVFFPGIGWATFEPTPAAAPAGTQVNDAAIDVASPLLPGESDATSDTPEQRGGVRTSPTPGLGAPAGGGGDSSGLRAGSVLGLVAGSVALAGLAAYGFRAVRRGRLSPEELAAAELGELERGLARLGSPLPPGTTLRGTRKVLQRLSGPGAAPQYATGLELHRYRDPEAAPPSVADRRALRRALISAPRTGSALRVLLAFPPGGPAIRHRARADRRTSRSARRQDPPSAGPTAAPV